MVKEGLAITFVAITNHIPMVVAMAHGILVSMNCKVGLGKWPQWENPLNLCHSSSAPFWILTVIFSTCVVINLACKLELLYLNDWAINHLCH